LLLSLNICYPVTVKMCDFKYMYLQSSDLQTVQPTYLLICCLLLFLLQYAGYVPFTCPCSCNWYDN